MSDLLEKLRGSEPLRLILWPALAVLVGWLVTRGIIDTSGADLITAVALLILGPVSIEAARSQVTPPAHLPAAGAEAALSAISHIRGQVAEAMGPTGTETLAQIEAMIQAAVSAAPARGRHAE